jgi:hypothetical protein
MLDVTNFLMRWLFLSNLIHNAPEIQTLPYNPYYATITPTSIPQSASTSNNNYHPHYSNSNPNTNPYIQQQQQQQPYAHHDSNQKQQLQHQHKAAGTTASSSTNSRSCEDEWRDQCLRGILSYPPGSQRLLIMDAMRTELVQRLAWSLKTADECLQQYEECRRYDRLSSSGGNGSGNVPVATTTEQHRAAAAEDLEVYYDDDADVDIMDRFGSSTDGINTPSDTAGDERDQREDILVEENNDDDPVVIITKNRTTISQSPKKSSKQQHANNKPKPPIRRPSDDEVDDAFRTVRVVRDYLPQLVSIVLKSPTAYDPNLIDPVDKLRSLIIQRCIDDANWGVDLCWLLEAEVGRAWKKIFEDRQQTGRRYIVYLDAERAAVLKHIGNEKREAFDLLQEAEQTTAFGFSTTSTTIDPSLLHHQGYTTQQQQPLPNHLPKRLPSSLSLRRCSHFGDTMQLIDQMTELSLDLRHVPTIRRHAVLQEGLKEMNRRIRRRMVTRGDVSLDVDDHLGADDWPRMSDITADMIQYSVHLPMDPKVRISNILFLVEESDILFQPQV